MLALQAQALQCTKGSLFAFLTYCLQIFKTTNSFREIAETGDLSGRFLGLFVCYHRDFNCLKCVKNTHAAAVDGYV